MGTLVDIQMPIKNDGFIASDVINRFLEQDVDWKLYINANSDLEFCGYAEQIRLTAESTEEEEFIRDRIRIAQKRNELRVIGGSPYIYLADADVQLPENVGIFRSMIAALERYPQLGALGMPYYDGFHVGAGSMMLRRENLAQIGEIRGGGSFCTCGYIAYRLLKFGYYTVPFKTVRAAHLKERYSATEEWKNYKAFSPTQSNNVKNNIYVWGKEELEAIAEDDESKKNGFRLVFGSLQPSN